MERFTDYYPPAVGKLRAEQIARIQSQPTIPDRMPTFARLTSIRMAPVNSSTETRINPFDPGTVDTPEWYDDQDKGWDRVVPAGRWR